MGKSMSVRNLNAWYGTQHALKNINIELAAKMATAIIGPSGCGKSTFIRCLNRMHETSPYAKVEGDILLGDDNLSDLDAVDVRRVVGMVFQNQTHFRRCPSSTTSQLAYA
ncbi:hypothetical protein GCM10025858_05190 [Alicyclobacillus sacchari]|nr:hypothetical protein GCM10025858_05190 [Alicyclobacillus sacchari]